VVVTDAVPVHWLQLEGVEDVVIVMLFGGTSMEATKPMPQE
jgi:hypothetical protein